MKSNLGGARSEAECKQHIVKALDEVSGKLGNSRSVCRKYYVHPGLIELYEQNNLDPYLSTYGTPEKEAGLSDEEQILMKILQFFHN